MSLTIEVASLTRPSTTLQLRTLYSWICSTLIGLLFVGGCGTGSPGPPREAFSGTVLREGIEIDSGAIMFIPTGGGPAASASIEDGSYTFDKRSGPVAGNYKVEITHFPQRDFQPGVPKKEAEIIKDTRFKKPMPPQGWVKQAVVEKNQAETIDFEID